MFRYQVLLLLSILVGLASSLAGAEKKTSQKTTSKSVAKASAAPRTDDRVINAGSLDGQTLGRQIWHKTNAERRKAGLPELGWNQALAVAATGHSADMAQRNYFSHKSKGFFRSSDLRDRTTKAGHAGGMIAENIAMLPTYWGQRYGTRFENGQYRNWVERDDCTYEQLADWAMEQWMNSPGHRKNILHPQLRTLGVGVALGNKDGVPYVYLTQNFGTN